MAVFQRKIIFLIGIFFLVLPLIAKADTFGQKVKFNVDPSYDLQKRKEILATLKVVSQKGYFYVENDWYENLKDEEKEKVISNLKNLAREFDETIYPKLTKIYGSEWKPGIDNDYHITILFHQMKEDAGGYFNSGDEYSRLQNPRSNEREMVYLNTKTLFSPILKSYLAHEFTHLITFNQKERLRGVSEEVWLNEARAEFAPTLLGYDQEYQGSYLQQRVKQFISSPSDSLTEWQGEEADYGVINLFTQYLVDHYGIEILADSLKSSKIGIDSINQALKENNFKEDFSQIFTQWTIALFLQDCQIGKRYCYKNQNLKNLRITPSLIFLPSTKLTKVDLNYSLKEWSGHWYRVMGGEGDLKLKFDGQDSVDFKVAYVLCKDSSNCQVNFLNLDQKQDGEISFKNFGKDWTSLTLIPSIQSKTSGFTSKEPSYSLSISVSMEIKSEREKLIEELKAEIARLKAKIAKLQAEIAKILRERISCQKIESDLYYGLKSSEVTCLQQFLKAQGPEIYPEGLVTGYFGPLTKKAVIRFQEKYASEILTPLGLKWGTGFVGPFTRSKINEFLNP